MLLVSRRTLSRFISVLACLIFVIWGFSEYGKSGDIPYEQAVGFLLALAAFLGSSRVSEKPVFQPSEKELAARYAFYRQAMLNRVRDFWVKGVLESSLHEEARIELGLEERRDAVAERPWDVILRTPDRPDCKLPPGTKISDVFERVGRSLLILGEPGAGKTTTLLELAREMIDRAGEDPSEKIPVVFNLSSWTDPKQPIADWLIEELRAKYNIPKKIAAPWVENDSLLLLLDGFDEVAPERREACIEAINVFLEEHFVPLVVCCRKEEYEALDSKLKLQSAILLQPLTPEQIDGYLERLSPEMAPLRDALKDDQELQEFARTPLILSIMTLAYRGMPIEELQSLGSIEDRRRHLFKTYVDQMFKRTTRIDPELYPKEKTIRWLSRLARKMSESSQTVFLIERMQPSWLETESQKWLYLIVVVLVIGLVFSLYFGLTGFFWIGESYYVLAGGLLGGMVGFVIGTGDKIKPAEILKWSWKEGLRGLILGLIFGLLCWSTIAMTNAMIGGLLSWMICGIILSLISWCMFVRQQVIGGIMSEMLRETIVEVMNELSDFENKYGLNKSNKNNIYLLFIPICGLIWGLMMWLIFRMVGGLMLGPAAGLFIAPMVGMLFGLTSGLSNTDLEMKIAPNQGIKQSAKNALKIGLISLLMGGLFFGLTFGLIFWQIYGQMDGLMGGLFFGLIGGLLAGQIGWLLCGGNAIIQHFALRFVLHRKNLLPWNLVPSLDYATERIFLRKVGGGYVFVHWMLMEYFASLEPGTGRK